MSEARVTKILHVLLSEADAAAVTARARRENRPVSYWIRQLIKAEIASDAKPADSFELERCMG